MAGSLNPRDAFIEASVWHGTLDDAEAMLAAHPEIAGSDIYTAALLGDDASVRRFLAADPEAATAQSGPLGWDALTHLCFSKYLRLDHSRTEGFVRAAEALLDAGASPNTGFWEPHHQPKPEWESVLYGAAGVAHHPEITRLLLARGGDPNDAETPYHAPETHDNAAVRVLLESGKLNPDSLATMLLRKADWHDHDGIRLLLDHGADPNRMTHWRLTALHQAVRRDNDLANVELMLDHGADPAIPSGISGRSAVVLAARRGRGDLLELFERRGHAVECQGVDRLIAACARNDAPQVREIVADEPALVGALLEEGATLLAEFAGTANSEGAALLLELGVPVDARYDGDGYFGIAPESTPLHVAAWRAWHGTVRFLIGRGANVEARDAQGRTPLALAVKACIDSYWAYRRKPDSVAALLEAGASPASAPFPSGYAEVDDVLRAHGRDTDGRISLEGPKRT